jgi:hypothetical protein
MAADAVIDTVLQRCSDPPSCGEVATVADLVLNGTPACSSTDIHDRIATGHTIGDTQNGTIGISRKLFGLGNGAFRQCRSTAADRGHAIRTAPVFNRKFEHGLPDLFGDCRLSFLKKNRPGYFDRPRRFSSSVGTSGKAVPAARSTPR